MIFDAAAIEEKIGYAFKDKMLLRKCFTHSSYINETKITEESNEVLEFFGDAIIEFLVTEYLCKNEKGDEGELTDRRKSFVSKEPLQKVVVDAGLEGYMLLGHGEAMNIKRNVKVLSSLFEAIVGGIYYDGGMPAAKKFVYNKLINPLVEAEKPPVRKVEKVKREKTQPTEENTQNPKNLFQEIVQKRKLGDISYETVQRTGLDHSPTFTVALLLNGNQLATGKGTSKKQAEMQAARFAVDKIIKMGKKR